MGTGNTSTRSIELLGSHMSYVDTGEGAPVLFLHGNPTSSFLWRDVIPRVAPSARCIAPDLIGFGASGRPDIPYRFEDHARFIEAFIDALGLEDVVLVLHDWGSALGLDWARRHQYSVRGLVLMEFIWPIPTWLDISAEGAKLFQAFRDPDVGRKLLIDENTFIEGNLPHGVVRKLPESVMNHYREPFLDPSSREPIYRFPNELPIAGRPDDVWAMATAYHDWLLDTDLPKLFFHVEPGSLIPPDRARWYSERLKSCRSVALGAGRHYLQEDHGEAIGNHIASWLENLR